MKKKLSNSKRFEFFVGAADSEYGGANSECGGANFEYGGTDSEYTEALKNPQDHPSCAHDCDDYFTIDTTGRGSEDHRVVKINV